MTNNIEIKAYTQQCICNHSRLSAGYASYTNRSLQAKKTPVLKLKYSEKNDNTLYKEYGLQPLYYGGKKRIG